MNPARGALLAANAKALFYAFAAEPVQTGRRVALDEGKSAHTHEGRFWQRGGAYQDRITTGACKRPRQIGHVSSALIERQVRVTVVPFVTTERGRGL